MNRAWIRGKRLEWSTLACGALSLAAATFIVFDPSPAYAGLEACGNINVKADARCQVQTSGGCTAQCEPVNVRAACSGKLTAQCNGQCNVDASVECTGSCKADCTGKCTADPGSFDCKGTCEGRCNADCDGKCSSNSSSTNCSGSCKASCSGQCDTQCSATPPSAQCDARCEASCKGSCKAQANATCQIDCQGKLEASCEAEVSGGCKARCQKPEGALFCDGQYVDTGNNLQNCIDALNAVLKIKVSGSAQAECTGNQCTAEAEGAISCSTANGAPASPFVPAIPLAASAMALLGLRRRRKDAR